MGMKGNKKLRRRFNKRLERISKHVHQEPVINRLGNRTGLFDKERYKLMDTNYPLAIAPRIEDFFLEYDGVEYISSISIGGLTLGEAREIVPQVRDYIYRAKRELGHLHVLVNYADGENIRKAYIEISRLGILRWPLLIDKICIGKGYKGLTKIYANVYGKTDEPEKIWNFHRVE